MLKPVITKYKHTDIFTGKVLIWKIIKQITNLKFRQKNSETQRFMYLLMQILNMEYLGKPQKKIHFSGPATKALPPPRA